MKMDTTELIKLLQSVEHGASGRAREISFYVGDEYIPNPTIKIHSTGDGIASAELTLLIEKTTD